MTGRIPCCVPFCRCTRGRRKNDRVPFERMLADGWRWICGKHWRLVAPETRARHHLWQRRVNKADARGLALPRLRARAHAIFEAARAEAIERAMGIRA